MSSKRNQKYSSSAFVYRILLNCIICVFFFQHATVFRNLIDENKHVPTESLFIPRVFK